MVGEPIRRTPPSAPARGVGALDRLAERMADTAGVRLSVADSPAELIAVHRLRYRVASVDGRATAADDRDGMERDAFDTRALQMCAWHGAALVGTLRLVLPVVGKPLPLEQAFGLTVEPDGEVVEVGCPLIELGGDAAQRAGDGLLAQAWFEARARGYTVMAGLASAELVERYAALGIAVEVLAESADGHQAVRLDPSLG